MKGTLFSADFIKDANGELRLLELNTDTQILTQELPNIDYTPFFNILQANSITKLNIMYKPYIHKYMVDHFMSAVSSSAGFITEVTLHDEDINTIYPTYITDEEDRFILRMVYDEAAIFDSTYAKSRLNLYNLFTEQSINDYTVAHYYSSSAGETNTLTFELNSGNIPDATIKDIDESFNPIDFFKIGTLDENETLEQRWQGFISENKAEDKLIEQFHFHSSNLDQANKLTSVRVFGIVYGSELNFLSFHSYKITSIFSIPESLDLTSTGDYSNKLSDKHYYEVTTNFIKHDSAGLLSTHKIQMEDSSWTALESVTVGDSIMSYYISGSPDVETNLEILNWESEGSSFPSGSFLTSSNVVFKDSKDLKYGGIIELKVDGDSIFSGITKQFLIYDSGSNKTTFKHSTEINPESDFFYDLNGELIDIDEANFYVTSDSNLKFVELDVEDTDTYIISGSTAFNSIVSHNAPCFIAGTQISLTNGKVKAIEDVKVGDIVLTFNHSTGKVEDKEVVHVLSKKVNTTVKYKFDNGKQVECTLDHPLFSTNGTYVSYSPEISLKQYGLNVGKIEIGTEILQEDGSGSKLVEAHVQNDTKVVYNLHNVQDNHNYFANSLLVHNRCFVAGTQITLADGSTRPIEEISKGENILSYNELTQFNEPGIVGDLKQHEVNSVIRITLDNENVIVTTQEHPFYVLGKGWVRAGDLQVLDECKKESNTPSIVSSVEVLNETHTVYNLLSVSSQRNFYANGILVHNK